MKIPYRTRLKLQRIGMVALLLLMVSILAWFCWVVWLERYVVYTREGATINFDLSSEELSGVVARPPVSDESGLDIYFNEGENAISTQTEMVQMNGYYVTVDDLVADFEGVKSRLAALPSGTPVMIEMKNLYGTFYYPSGVSYAQSESVNVDAMVSLIDELEMRGLYLIAKVPAFRDYLFGLNNITSGLPIASGKYRGSLWMDSDGYYWLKPNDASTINYLTNIILELKELGFDEVVLSEFRVPDTDQISYHGDRAQDLISTASALISSCATDFFTISFMVNNASFALPEGRCRMYLEGVSPASVGSTVAQVTVTDPEIRLVFVTDANDTRYDEYSVLRPLEASDVLETE